MTTRRLCWVWVLLLVFFLPMTMPSSTAFAAGKIGKDCTFKGRKLFGKVKVVTAFPDLKVQIVDTFPDLKVQAVDAFPDKCGKWKMVDAFPDLKIQFVKAFPDIKIKYVTAFPGLP
jgi:hypothetical protein